VTVSDTEDTFNRAFARFEEIQTQYRADRERLIADVEAQQQELAEFAKERQRLKEETLARVADVTATEEDEQASQIRNGWSESVKPRSEFSFGFEDEPTTESFKPAAASPNSSLPQDAKTITKPQSDEVKNSDDDFFGTADWLKK
jgi:hypothetical protein